MPRKSEWFEQLPRVLAALAHFPAPVVDRASLEILFGVSRRQAIRLMARFGGHQAGRTYLIETSTLISQLEALLQSGPVQSEQRRRQKLHLNLERERSASAARAIPIQTLSAPALPPQIEVNPGTLRIRFDDTAQLLSLLHCLIHTIAQDLETFQSTADRNVIQDRLLI